MANYSFELELTAEMAQELCGSQDRHLKTIGECFYVDLVVRNNRFTILNGTQETADKIKEVLTALVELIKHHQTIQTQDVIYACRTVDKNVKAELGYKNKFIARTVSGKNIVAKTQGQAQFIEAMEKKDIVFAIGPAGTGKTYLAVVQAVSLLKRGEIKKIVLTRPAVEAGESLGFLPGDLKEKVDPYLTPLYDALHEMLGAEQTEKLVEKQVIEIAPLAYMRGRTLNEAMVILDEAQNTTSSQMKMFLTRLGERSKMVITGDITQIDLKTSQVNGLIEAEKVLKDIREIEILHLTADDVVRHPLVQKIIESYAQKGASHGKNTVD